MYPQNTECILHVPNPSNIHPEVKDLLHTAPNESKYSASVDVALVDEEKPVFNSNITTSSGNPKKDQANTWVRFAPLLFILMPFAGIDGMYHATMAVDQRFISSSLACMDENMAIPSALLASFLSGTCNKLTDLIDDEGLFSRYQGKWSLHLLQVILKTSFPGFFVLLFAFNLYAAGVLAATYSFAWVIRGKVGNPSKPLETIICVAFLPGAFSLVGGALMDAVPFFHAFVVALLSHVVWLRLVRSWFPKKKQHQFKLITELGMFRYVPMLGLFLTHDTKVHGFDNGGNLLAGVLIILCDNVGYFLTKYIWMYLYK